MLIESHQQFRFVIVLNGKKLCTSVQFKNPCKEYRGLIDTLFNSNDFNFISMRPIRYLILNRYVDINTGWIWSGFSWDCYVRVPICSGVYAWWNLFFVSLHSWLPTIGVTTLLFSSEGSVSCVIILKVDSFRQWIVLMGIVFNNFLLSIEIRLF